MQSCVGRHLFRLLQIHSICFHFFPLEDCHSVFSFPKLEIESMSVIHIFSSYHGSSKHDILRLFSPAPSISSIFVIPTVPWKSIFSIPKHFWHQKCHCNFSSMAVYMYINSHCIFIL